MSKKPTRTSLQKLFGNAELRKMVGKKRIIFIRKWALDIKIYNFQTIQNMLETNLDLIDFEQEQLQEPQREFERRGTVLQTVTS